jgi:hypothetical protein
VTPQEQMREDVRWLERLVGGERYEVIRDFPLPLARRILAALSARQEPDEYVMELENVVCDALHTLENEMTAGTRFDETEWVRGTLAALRSIKGTMDDRDPNPPSDEPQPQRPANEPLAP